MFIILYRGKKLMCTDFREEYELCVCVSVCVQTCICAICTCENL